MVTTVKLYMLKLISKSTKTNNSMKLVVVVMKLNNSILLRLEMAKMAQNMQKCLIFIVVLRVRVENQVS